MNESPLPPKDEKPAENKPTEERNHAANAVTYGAGADLHTTDLDEESSISKEIEALARRMRTPKQPPK
jgi:hypothetical protein